MVFENRSQHAALLDTAAADSRSRVLGELNLRADDWRGTLPNASPEGSCTTTATVRRRTRDLPARRNPARRDRSATPPVASSTRGAAQATPAVASRAAPSTPVRAERAGHAGRRRPANRRRSRDRNPLAREASPESAAARTHFDCWSARRCASRCCWPAGSAWSPWPWVWRSPGGPAAASTSPSPRSSRAPTGSRKAIIRGRWKSGGATNSASCRRRSSACARSCARPRSTRTT